MTAKSDATAIRIDALVKRFERVVAVDGLDLVIAQGQCFALLGPNGAGKTTTVEIMEGIQEPTSGRVEIFGLTWREGGRRMRERLGVQLQETRFPERLKVRETIALFRSFYRKGLEPLEAMATVRLEEKAEDYVKNLSGGQRQRLSLACALVGDPDILFLDEPTTGLDPQARLKIWEIVEDLRRRGRTIVLTTHYMEEAERLADRVAVIDKGRLIALGTPSELIASLGAEHVIEFTCQREPEAGVLESVPGVSSVAREQGRIRLTVSSIHGALPALLRSLERDGAEIDDLTTHHASLEDVFVSLTGRHLRDG
jgi:ABC-2 type transport system ATP-binding protein